CRETIAQGDGLAVTHSTLGNCLRESSRIEEAIASYSKAVEIWPTYARADSNRVYAIHFSPEYGSAEIYRELRRWNEVHAKPLAKFIQPHGNDRAADRKLKVGYVSPYFHSHAESYFVLPLLRGHDHGLFEIHCYSDGEKADEITAQHRAC